MQAEFSARNNDALGTLRADHNVQLPFINVQVCSAKPRDRIHHHQRVGPDFAGKPRYPLRIIPHAGRAFRGLEEDSPDISMLLKCFFHLVERNSFAVRRFYFLNLQAISLAQLQPALSKLAGGSDQHAVARREKVRDGGFHRPRAR